MPDDQTAIPPPEEITGSTTLPLARVKKILKMDEEINRTTNQSAFVITLATEMFIRYLAEQAHNVAKTDTKPRRTVQYQDVATAVARLDNLQFLSDLIPRTTTWREMQDEKVGGGRKASSKKARTVPAGQRTLDGKQPMVDHDIRQQTQPQDDVASDDTGDEIGDDISDGIEDDIEGEIEDDVEDEIEDDVEDEVDDDIGDDAAPPNASTSGSDAAQSPTGAQTMNDDSDMVFEHDDLANRAKRDSSGDIEMD